MEQYEKIIRYIEPIYRFCVNRLSDRGEAEDLAQEILVHVLDGMGKYEIKSLDAWVWRIAHNRYARRIESRKTHCVSVSDEVLNLYSIADERDFIDELSVTDDYQPIFAALHTLCAEYRELLVDYYIGEMPVKELTEKYGLPQSTVKWRLNAGRQKIKERMEDLKLDKIYKRINWNTGTCNGSMNPDQYLHTQLARAICEAAYKKPLSVEEISLATGIPALYVEDELTRLENGDAVEKVGGKYAANFIILRQSDRTAMDKKFAPLAGQIADYYTRLFTENDKKSKRSIFTARISVWGGSVTSRFRLLCAKKSGISKTACRVLRTGRIPRARTAAAAGSLSRRRRMKTKRSVNIPAAAMPPEMMTGAPERVTFIIFTCINTSILRSITTAECVGSMRKI